MGSDSTRDRLLTAAAVEIARHGLKGASLRDVAAGADIRAASIFHYFPNGKDELARAVLDHIMGTIATRMTPTIDAAHGLAPADLIVQCAASFWDFLADHPAYSGVLMREAFAPDDAIAEIVQDHARSVVKLATAYIEAAQGAGELRAFDTRRFLLRLASFAITFHASPTMRRYILGAHCSFRDEREAFLASVRAEVAPVVSGEAEGRGRERRRMA
jgi:AcrR family transcriptional regulator